MPENSRKIYCIGGRNSYIQFMTIEKYDIDCDKWREIKT